ncbi:hypothetical protein PybrP1_011215, partial [[Pythium] brassicae (nom. inval.)]
VENTRFKSLWSVAVSVAKAISHSASPSTVRSRLNVADLYGRSTRKKLHLNKIHKAKPLAYAKSCSESPPHSGLGKIARGLDVDASERCRYDALLQAERHWGVLQTGVATGDPADMQAKRSIQRYSFR